MIHTESGRYAIRAVTYLGSRYNPDSTVTSAEIAEAEDIPPFYLAKVLQDLARARVLISIRGRGGGFRLSRPPEQIPVLEVLGAVEDLGRLREACVLGLEACSDSAPCALHSVWSAFRDTLLARFSEITVADLVRELSRKRSGPSGSRAPGA